MTAENAFYLPGGEHGGNASVVEAYLGLAPFSLIDLSMSMNPFAENITALLSDLAYTVGIYPNSEKLQLLLAEILDVDHRYLLLTNGAAEAIALVAHEVKVAKVDEPEFSLWKKHLCLVSKEAGLVKSNPVNPTGELVPENLRAMVFDEAFYPLTKGEWSRRDFDSSSTIVIGSLTKLFAIPGLRLGYLICKDESKLARMKKRQPEWPISSLSIAVAEQLLPGVDLALIRKKIIRRQQELYELLTSYDLKVNVCQAPWLLIENASWLRYFLALEKVLLRDLTSFGMPSMLRMGLPNDSQMDFLAKALPKAIHKGKQFHGIRKWS
jgi:threonine-phosphate decarboxylase